MKTVAVVSPHACIRTHKLASIVKNYRKVLITPVAIDSANESYYDDIIRAPQLDIKSLIEINPNLIHYHNEPNEPAHYLLQNLPHVPLIFDCHDMVSFARNTANPVEEFIFHKAAAVIHVNEALEERAKKQYRMRTSAVFYSYVSETHFSSPTENKIGDVVYQGGFTRMPNSHRNLVPIFQTFAASGYSVDIYPSWPQEHTDPDTKVRIHERLPYAELMCELSKYKYGFVGYNHDALDYRSEFLDASLPNKFFEYLAAGLPVIVYRAALVARIVEEEKIGIVLEKPLDIKMLEDVDYEQLVSNVLRVRSKFVLEQQGERLEAFYERILSSSESFEKVGRNNPCPCGSGKKYKRCCG